MGNSIKKFNELQIEQNKLKMLGDEQVKQMKQSFKKVQNEGQNALIRKILIPAGAALIIGYGLKKLVDILSSEDNHSNDIGSGNRDGSQPIYHREESIASGKRNSVLSKVDWADLAVRAAPFIIGVGKKMYEDGNLPFFDPPANVDPMNDD